MNAHRNLQLIKMAFEDELSKIAFVPMVGTAMKAAVPFLKEVGMQMGTQAAVNMGSTAVENMVSGKKNQPNSIQGGIQGGGY